MQRNSGKWLPESYQTEENSLNANCWNNVSSLPRKLQNYCLYSNTKTNQTNPKPNQNQTHLNPSTLHIMSQPVDLVFPVPEYPRGGSSRHMYHLCLTVNWLDRLKCYKGFMIDFKAIKNCELWRLHQPFLSLVLDAEGSLRWTPSTSAKHSV